MFSLLVNYSIKIEAGNYKGMNTYYYYKDGRNDLEAWKEEIRSYETTIKRVRDL